MTKSSIISKFDEIEKNIELCKNPNNGDFAFGVIFNTDKFMTYYNEFQTVYDKSNFELHKIKTDNSLKIITVFIVIKHNASCTDRLKMKIFLTWALDVGIIDFFN